MKKKNSSLRLVNRKMIIVSSVIILVSLLCLSNFFEVSSESQSEIDKAVSYLKTQPQTAWSTMALAGAGESGIDLNHLKSVPDGQKSSTTYAKYILALKAAGENPANFGNENYVEKLKAFYQNGQFGEENYINDDIWSILALGSIGQEDLAIVQDAKDYILSNQNPDGGWSYDISFSSSDTNDTAVAIMALLKAGVSNSSSAIQNALNFLKSLQNEDGGFAYLAGSVSDSCSDAWVVSAIYRVGQNPGSSNWTKNGKNALDHLKSLQDEDGGFWWQSEGDNKFCSPYAAISLLEKYYPVQAVQDLHHLRIEGKDSNICDIKTNGGTAMDLIIKGSEICGYDYLISEYPGMGLYLAEINGQADWMYMVNNISPMRGADSYYLEAGDEVLWFSGGWLDKGWFQTMVELTETEDMVKIQVKYYDSTSNDWQNLETEGVKLKIGTSELTTNNLGAIEISLNSIESGFYRIFVETQIIDETGYIRSEKVNLTIGEAPKEHQAGLRVEIEKIEVPPGEQGTISFLVSPDILDFGKLKPGESSSQNLTINNKESEIYLEVEVNGADVFQNNLEVDEEFWQFFLTELEANQEKTLPVKLNIPFNYDGDFGQQEGELTFWAIKR